MASEYNSILIDKLYKVDEYRQADDIISQMQEIADPVFIRPVVSAYFKFKEASNAHYYLGILNEIDSREVLDVLLEIVNDPDIRPLIFTYALEGFLKYEYFNEDIIVKAEEILSTYSVENTNINEDALLEYLLKVDRLKSNDLLLQKVFEDENFPLRDRALFLEYLLKIDSEKWLQYYLDNHEKIHGSTTEIILSKMLLSWKGQLVEKLKEKIFNNGGARAKEIIEKSRAKEAEKQNMEEIRSSAIYSNAQVVTEIINVREKINLITKTSNAFGFEILLPSESILKQIKSAKTEDDFKNSSLELRYVVQNIAEDVSTHGISFEDAQKIIEGLTQESFNKSINSLHLYLISKGIILDKNIYGLRLISRTLNLFAHPEKKDDLLGLLTEMGLGSFYTNEEWEVLHKKLLQYYLDVLNMLHKELIGFI